MKTQDEIPSYQHTDDKTLTEIKIPEGIFKIGEYAFSGCISLVTVEIPTTLRVIGQHAFSGCKLLKTIKLCHSDNENIDLGDDIVKIGKGTFENCDSITSVVLPKNLSYMGPLCFFSCKSLKSVIMDCDGIDFIMPYTFGNCEKLESLTLSINVNKLWSFAFINCRGLTEIRFIGDVNIGESSFKNCENLITASLSKRSYVELSAFSGCDKMNILWE